MPNDCDRLSLVQAHAIKNFRMAGHFIMRNHGAIQHSIYIENAGHRAQSGKNAILLGKNRARRALVRIDTRVTCRIARSPVFEKSVLDNRSDASAIEVHSFLGGDSRPRLSCGSKTRGLFPNRSPILSAYSEFFDAIPPA